VPDHIDRALARALSRHAADRFESVADFARALEGGEQPVAPPAAARPARRRRAVVTLALAALALFAAAAGWYVSKRQAGTSAAREGPRVLVVLPFKNLGQPADQYFADGLTEELTSRLAGLSGLRVISRTSADQYRASTKSLKAIGAELGASYVLEGSVRWERGDSGRPGRIRVTPQLIQVRDDSHLWSRAYEEELGAVFAVQSAIAEQVTTALDVTLRVPERAALAAGGTRTADAYDLYLRGLDYLNRSTQAVDLRAAADLFAEAVAADPQFALGQARLARAHLQVYWHYYDHTDARLQLARNALDAAVALAPDLPETHIALGYYHYYGQLDYEGALREFETALRRQPGNAELLQAIGYVERRQGRWEESTAHFVEGLRYDPRSGVRNFDIGDNYLMMRRFPEAEHYLNRAIVLSPDWPNPYVYKAWMYVSWQGDLARARGVLGQAVNRLDVNRFAASMSAGDRISASLITADSTFGPMIDALTLAAFTGDSPRYHTLKAEHAQFRGDRKAQIAHGDSARALLLPRVEGGPHEPRMLTVLALAYAHMGRHAEAIEAGERAVKEIPIAKDAVSAPFFHTNLALVYMYAGRLDQAVDVLAPLLRVPCWITPAELRVDPIWEPLRSNLRFRKLMEG
jgi:serine/threonine-protein kinase